MSHFYTQLPKDITGKQIKEGDRVARKLKDWHDCGVVYKTKSGYMMKTEKHYTPFYISDTYKIT